MQQIDPESMAVWRGMVLEALKHTSDALDKKASQEALEHLKEAIERCFENCRYSKEKCEQRFDKLADKDDVCALDKALRDLKQKVDERPTKEVFLELKSRVEELMKGKLTQDKDNAKRRGKNLAYKTIGGVVLTLLGILLKILFDFNQK